MRRRPPIRAAIVGAGLMGRWHADAVVHAGGIITSVVDVNLDNARALVARHPRAQMGAEFDDVGLRINSDVVHLCTPLETHAPLIRKALKAGLHVLAEKPLTESVEVTAEVLALAATHARLLCPTHQFLFQAGVRRAFEALGHIGPLLHVDLLACSAGAVGGSPGAAERLIGEILPHPLALLARLFPGELASVEWQIQHAREGELRATARMGLASIAVLLSAHGRPTANGLRVIGERGTLNVDLFHGFVVIESGAFSRVHKLSRPFVYSAQTFKAAGFNLAQRAVHGEAAYPGLRELVSRFYAAIGGHGTVPISHDEILDVAIARDAIIAGLR